MGAVLNGACAAQELRPKGAAPERVPAAFITMAAASLATSSAARAAQGTRGRQARNAFALQPVHTRAISAKLLGLTPWLTVVAAGADAVVITGHDGREGRTDGCNDGRQDFQGSRDSKVN